VPDERKEILSRHLREEKAKRKSKTFDSLVRRLRLEQEFRKILSNLKENGISWEELLPSLLSGQISPCTPDFLVWKDDVKVPIFLVDYSEGEDFRVLRSELLDYLIFFKKTEYDLISITWMASPNFPSKILKIIEAERMTQKQNESFVFSDVSPFEEKIVQVFSEKAPIWPVPKCEKLPKLEKPKLLLKTFQPTFKEIMQAEARRRRPHLEHRKKALSQISDKEFEGLGLLFDKYLSGEISAEDVGRSLKELSQVRIKI